jgi:hypothetical protein
MRSAFKYGIKQVYSNRELADLLLIENRSLSAGFPEVFAALLLFLTIPLTAASAECSFPKLKIIKNYCRCMMSQDRLQRLALPLVE